MPTEEEHVKKVMDESKVDTVILGAMDGSVKIYKDGELVKQGGIEVGAAYSSEQHVFCMLEPDDDWLCEKFNEGIEDEGEPVDG